jgi:hypothetical protein
MPPSQFFHCYLRDNRLPGISGMKDPQHNPAPWRAPWHSINKRLGTWQRVPGTPPCTCRRCRRDIPRPNRDSRDHGRSGYDVCKLCYSLAAIQHFSTN